MVQGPQQVVSGQMCYFSKIRTLRCVPWGGSVSQLPHCPVATEALRTERCPHQSRQPQQEGGGQARLSSAAPLLPSNARPAWEVSWGGDMSKRGRRDRDRQGAEAGPAGRPNSRDQEGRACLRKERSRMRMSRRAWFPQTAAPRLPGKEAEAELPTLLVCPLLPPCYF